MRGLRTVCTYRESLYKEDGDQLFSVSVQASTRSHGLKFILGMLNPQPQVRSGTQSHVTRPKGLPKGPKPWHRNGLDGITL